VLITFDIPDELVESLRESGKDISRVALEALAAEGYRDQRLSEFEIRCLLGFDTRMEVHAFLKEHGAYLHYSEADLDQDWETAQSMKTKRRLNPEMKDSGSRREIQNFLLIHN
jgi:uncharacterized protein UPF0175